MKNIQREEFRGRAADGGDVRIEQVASFELEAFKCQNISIPAGCGRFQPAEEKPQD